MRFNKGLFLQSNILTTYYNTGIGRGINLSENLINLKYVSELKSNKFFKNCPILINDLQSSLHGRQNNSEFGDKTGRVIGIQC